MANTLFDTRIGDVNALTTSQIAFADILSDAGVSLTGTATAGAMGLSRTAGTSFVLVGEATSASAKTDKAMFQYKLGSFFTPGSTIPITINANYATTGTVTAASTSITLVVYTWTAGVETAVTGVTAAQLFTATAANYVFLVPTTGFVRGQVLNIEIVMLVTTSAGAATGQVNSITVQA